MLILIPLIAVVAFIVLIAGGGDDSSAGKRASAKPAAPLPPIVGDKIEFEGLIYNVTDVRVLDFDDPADAPYTTNLQRPHKGNGFLGVFLRIYNPTGRAAVSAPGLLLEPSKDPGQVEQILPSESQYAFTVGESVPANGVIPAPESKAAAGEVLGAMLLYPVTTESIKAQPFDLVIHSAKGGLANLRLPKVPKLHS